MELKFGIAIDYILIYALIVPKSRTFLNLTDVPTVLALNEKEMIFNTFIAYYSLVRLLNTLRGPLICHRVKLVI